MTKPIAYPMTGIENVKDPVALYRICTNPKSLCILHQVNPFLLIAGIESPDLALNVAFDELDDNEKVTLLTEIINNDQIVTTEEVASILDDKIQNMITSSAFSESAGETKSETSENPTATELELRARMDLAVIAKINAETRLINARALEKEYEAAYFKLVNLPGN